MWWHRSVCVINSLRSKVELRECHDRLVASLCMCHQFSQVESMVAGVS